MLVRVQEARGLGPVGLGLGVVGFGFLGARPQLCPAALRCRVNGWAPGTRGAA
jgi:phosphoglycerate dehydrogenase-like enzyme